MKKGLVKKTAVILLALLLLVPYITASGIVNEDVGAKRPNSKSIMSVEEILNDINARLGSDLEALPPTQKGELHASEIFFTGQELLDVIELFESSAIEVLENNASVDRIWYERTGIPPEEIEWITDECDDIYNETTETDSSIQSNTATYNSTRNAWGANSWITATARGTIFITSPRRFQTISSVSSHCQRMVGILYLETFKRSSHTLSFIDSGRTAAVNITGVLTRTYPLGVTTTQTLKVYTEFHAGNP